MADNFIIDTDPLISNATGGVKLFVKTEQLNFAKQILSEISPYSLDDQGKSIICPECGENKVRLETTVKEKRSLLAFLFGFFVAGGLPVYVKYKYRCMSCDKEFNI
jgi:DNA-directed RNA polymerase subunit RPC12/RpoP